MSSTFQFSSFNDEECSLFLKPIREVKATTFTVSGGTAYIKSSTISLPYFNIEFIKAQPTYIVFEIVSVYSSVLSCEYINEESYLHLEKLIIRAIYFRCIRASEHKLIHG